MLMAAAWRVVTREEYKKQIGEWLYLTDNEWKKLDPATSNLLEHNYKSNVKNFTFETDGQTTLVDFHYMIITNQNTNLTQQKKRCV